MFLIISIQPYKEITICVYLYAISLFFVVDEFALVYFALFVVTYAVAIHLFVVDFAEIETAIVTD